jgi:hypothetical protein
MSISEELDESFDDLVDDVGSILNQSVNDALGDNTFSVGELEESYVREALRYQIATDERTLQRINEQAEQPHALSMKVGFYKWLTGIKTLTQASVNELRREYLGKHTIGWFADTYEDIYRRRSHANPPVAPSKKRKQAITISDEFGEIQNLGYKSKRKQMSIMTNLKIDPKTEFQPPPVSATFNLKKQKQYQLHQSNPVGTYFIVFHSWRPIRSRSLLPARLRVRSGWTPDEDGLLVSAVQLYDRSVDVPWGFIAERIIGTHDARSAFAFST